MKYLKYTSWLLFALFGCEETIDWPVESDEIRLVVEGRITNEFKAHRLSLTQTADYFNPADPVPVRDATVTISDGETTFTFLETSPGIYLSEAFAGVVGRTYDLSISLSSPLTGETAFSASTTMLAPPVLDSLYAANFFEEDDGELFEYTLLAFWGTGNRELENGYLMEVYVNDQLETDTLTEVVAFTDDFLAEEFANFEFYYIDEPAAEVGDSITLIMHTVENDFVDFHEQLLTESEPRDPFGLSSPPANVATNISGGALGFFYASAADTVHAFVLEGEEDGD